MEKSNKGIEIEICNKINIKGSPESLLQKIRRELVIHNPIYQEAQREGRSVYGIPELIVNFGIDGSTVHVPRGYLTEILEYLKNTTVPFELEDNRSVTFVNYGHKIKLRTYQYNALTQLAKNTEGVLVSPAGSGKTVMGIALIIMSKQRALWITHTKQLLNQFVDRLKAFTDIKTVGMIKEGEITIGDEVTIGMVQTMVRRPEELRQLRNTFGIVIVDECHHVPSSTFTTVIGELNPYYLYGLTATPKRRDGLETLLYQNIGPIRANIPRKLVVSHKSLVRPTVKVIQLDTQGLEGDNYQKLIKSIIHNETRNDIIIQDIVAEYVEGNICVVMSDRKIHARALYRKLQDLDVPVGLVLGEHSDKVRKDIIGQLESGNIKVLVCTSQLLGEGFDFAPLNRLFITTPFRNAVRCEQIVGRIQRPSPGKNDAVVYDYVDINHGLLKHQFKNNGPKGSRFSVYKKLGCNIHYYERRSC